MKHTTFLISALVTTIFVLLIACNNEEKKATSTEPLDTEEMTKNQPEEHGMEIKPGEVEVTSPLNQAWVDAGKGIYSVKCR